MRDGKGAAVKIIEKATLRQKNLPFDIVSNEVQMMRRCSDEDKFEKQPICGKCGLTDIVRTEQSFPDPEHAVRRAATRSALTLFFNANMLKNFEEGRTSVPHLQCKSVC